MLKKVLGQVSSVATGTLSALTPPAPVQDQEPGSIPVDTPLPSPGFSPPSTANHRVLVRTFYEEMTPAQAQGINFVLEETLEDFTMVVPSVRKLRASRDLQSFCRAHCNDPRYGCKWCKVNDVYSGADCNRYCRRREAEGVNLLPGNDALATGYVSNRNQFTPEQDETCAKLLASIVSTKDVIHFTRGYNIILIANSSFVSNLNEPGTGIRYE